MKFNIEDRVILTHELPTLDYVHGGVPKYTKAIVINNTRIASSNSYIIYIDSMSRTQSIHGSNIELDKEYYRNIKIKELLDEI